MKLTPGDLARWDWYRRGLVKLIAKTGRTYRPEDVYHRVLSGTAFLVDVEDFGFMVLTQEHDHDGPVVFVWIIWCEPGRAVGRKAEIYAALEQLAREAKAKRIRMQSGFEGWSREKFFKQVAVVYEHEVK